MELNGKTIVVSQINSRKDLKKEGDYCHRTEGFRYKKKLGR